MIIIVNDQNCARTQFIRSKIEDCFFMKNSLRTRQLSSENDIKKGPIIVTEDEKMSLEQFMLYRMFKMNEYQKTEDKQKFKRKFIKELKKELKNFEANVKQNCGVN